MPGLPSRRRRGLTREAAMSGGSAASVTSGPGGLLRRGGRDGGGRSAEGGSANRHPGAAARGARWLARFGGAGTDYRPPGWAFAMNDSVAVVVSAFFVTGITVGPIAGLTISSRKTFVRLSMPAVSSYRDRRRAGPLASPASGIRATALAPGASAGRAVSWKQRIWKQRKSNAMESIKIRELRGTALRERARDGQPLAITNRGALVGVLIPVTQAWVEHLIDYNWSHVRQSIAEGEQAMAAGTSMLTIDDVVAQADARGYHEERRHGSPERLAVPLVAAVVGGTVMQPPETRETLERLRALLNPPGSAEELAEPSVHTIRIGELSAERIEQAGEAGQTLALTHDRELVGIVIPVTRGLVEFLVEQNISRVLYNIVLGEKQLATPDKMTTLEQALEQADPAGAANAVPPPSRVDREQDTGNIR
jgi:hypothetical protein